MQLLTVRFMRLSEDAILPTYSHGPEEDAGMDLYSTGAVTLRVGETKLISTGIAIELPPGFEGQIRPRSGMALKHGVTILNSPGTIDPSYRGEVKVMLTKLTDPRPLEINKGDRIAQLVVSEYIGVRPKEVQDLKDSKRGKGGFGSTGK
jgi:dUTP pyrophosphatase